VFWRVEAYGRDKERINGRHDPRQQPAPSRSQAASAESESQLEKSSPFPRATTEKTVSGEAEAVAVFESKEGERSIT